MYQHYWCLRVGTGEKFVEIKASNGRVIAECKTQATAEKIIKGLYMYEEYQEKIKHFKL